MIDVHLYGKLRRFSNNADPKLQSIASIEWQAGSTTVGQIIDRLVIPRGDVGTNVFLNGRYADLESLVQDGDRLGLFPDDMQLLYKWYFDPNHGSGEPNQDSAGPVSSNEDEK